MGARPPIVFFRQLRDLESILSADPIQNFTLKEWERLIDASLQDIQCFLPPATGSKHMFRPLKVDASDHIAEVFANGSDLIHDSSSIVLVQQWSGTWLIDARPGFWDDTSADFPNGIPDGGTAGQVLRKLTGDNYDAVWTDPPLGFTPVDTRPTNLNEVIAAGTAMGFWP